MGLLYEELTYKLRGCVFDVYNALGTGYDEETYHIAMVERLRELDIPFQSKVPRFIEHRGKNVHKFIADLIIADQIIVELKYLQTDFTSLNYLQIISYLKCWQQALGLLVNFGRSSAVVKRVLYSKQPFGIQENYDAISDLITLEDKPYLRSLREAILTISNKHGLGYGESVYHAILQEELTYQGVAHAPQITIPVSYNGNIIRRCEIAYPIIANKIICGIAAVKDDITLDIAKLQTYLFALDLPYGILVHFGKKRLVITGIRS